MPRDPALADQIGQELTLISERVPGVRGSVAAAIVAVLGTTELNIAILNYQARPIIERVAEHLADIARRPPTDPGYPPATPWAPAGQPDPDGTGPLPTRR